LLLTMSDGGRARGTGWLTNATTVVTAGHCVHEGDGGSFYSSIEVIPGAYVARVDGFDVLRRPFGSKTVGAQSLRASEAWKSSGSMASDYGAILLDGAFSGADGSPATLPIAVLSDSELTNSQVHLSGYPGDKPTGTQWEHGGPFSRVDRDRLSYMIDTIGGQSGSAVYRGNGDDVQVVGIHNYGGCPNRCTRITDAVAADLRSWQSSEGTTRARPRAEATESPAASPQRNDSRRGGLRRGGGRGARDADNGPDRGRD
jgi:V8-like Glu-specific endopeptidase